MRSKYEVNPAFVVGLVSGLGLAGVTLLAAGAMRRARARRSEKAELGHYIDGVKEPDEVELAIGPAEESNASGETPRLESEMPEFTPMSQRW